MKAVRQKKTLSHAIVAVEQDRIEVNVADIGRFAAVALHFPIHLLHNIPASALLRRLLNRGVKEKGAGRVLLKDFDKSLGALDDESNILTRTYIVAAAVVYY